LNSKKYIENTIKDEIVNKIYECDKICLITNLVKDKNTLNIISKYEDKNNKKILKKVFFEKVDKNNTTIIKDINKQRIEDQEEHLFVDTTITLLSNIQIKFNDKITSYKIIDNKLNKKKQFF